VHDYFDILGLSRDARAQEIRRACQRRSRQGHPDIDGDDRIAGAAYACAVPGARPTADPSWFDVAVDFIEMGPIVDRMRTAFFA
jgi:hypothetical protein